jgi:hypothetical protein
MCALERRVSRNLTEDWSEEKVVSERARRFLSWIARIALGMAIGLALGFTIGWWFWPVQYTNTAPSVLRRDYRDDYVLMVATAYALGDGGSDRAQERLRLLDSENPAAPVVELAERLVRTGGGREDIDRLANLASALGAVTPELAPYLQGEP